MLNIKQFRKDLVRPTLQGIKLWCQASENLVVGTSLQESMLTELVQDGGVALGLMQVEPATYHDICTRLASHYSLRQSVLDYTYLRELPSDPNVLIGNITLSIIICRIKFYFSAYQLPDATDINGLARMYKTIYNTSTGKATEENFVKLYEQYAQQA